MLLPVGNIPAKVEETHFCGRTFMPVSNQRLAGKTAVITGTASGQGRAAALAFAEAGAVVVGCDMDNDGRGDCRCRYRGRGPDEQLPGGSHG
jgi:hypothetical protein